MRYSSSHKNSDMSNAQWLNNVHWFWRRLRHNRKRPKRLWLEVWQCSAHFKTIGNSDGLCKKRYGTNKLKQTSHELWSRTIWNLSSCCSAGSMTTVYGVLYSGLEKYSRKMPPFCIFIQRVLPIDLFWFINPLSEFVEGFWYMCVYSCMRTVCSGCWRI